MSRRGKGRKREACSRGGKGRVPGGREGCGQVVREGWRERGTGVPPGFSSVAGRARGEGGQSASSFLGGTRAGRDASAGGAAGKERAETRRAAGPDDARKGRDEGSGKGVSWACPGPPRERDRPPYLKGQHGTPPDGGMPLTGLPLPLNARPDAGTHAFSSCPPQTFRGRAWGAPRQLVRASGQGSPRRPGHRFQPLLPPGDIAPRAHCCLTLPPLPPILKSAACNAVRPSQRMYAGDFPGCGFAA